MTRYALYADSILAIAIEAGEAIMPFYKDHSVEVQIKDDNSPVTAADLAANDLIVQRLKNLTPEIPIISEEIECRADRQDYPLFWCVDPLDGTKSFIRKQGDFTVNIALIENGVPIGGVVVVPVPGICYYTGGDGLAYKQQPGELACRIQVRAIPIEGVTVVASRSHADEETTLFIASLPKVAEKVSVASSLKFCLVAEGKADIYPRFGPTCIWDTAAGHAVLRAAGGKVLKAQTEEELRYSVLTLLNPNFVALG